MEPTLTSRMIVRQNDAGNAATFAASSVRDVDVAVIVAIADAPIAEAAVALFIQEQG